MRIKDRNLYITRFKPLFKEKSYDGAFELLDNNPHIERYLSEEEKRIMNSYKSKLNEVDSLLDRLNSSLDTLLNLGKDFSLEMAGIKFGWAHRN